MSVENKCPLCGKINPISEWVCESCGAKLPMSNQREAAPPRPPLVQQSSAPSAQKKPLSGKQLASVFAFFLFFVLLPLRCALSPREAATRSPSTAAFSPPAVVAPAAPPSAVAPNADLSPHFPVVGVPSQASRVAPSQASRVAPSVVAPGAASGQGAPRVWVNSKTGIYHYPGGRWFGNTSDGYYTTEADAIAKGNRATER